MRGREAQARRRGALAAALLGLGLLASSLPAAAEVKRVEVLGVAPTQAPRGERGTPRERALAAAIREGVERVASQKLRGRGTGDLGALLGDPRDYAVRYRILEDRGERPGRAGPERTLLAEIHVEVDRVERRLAEAGLLGNAGEASGERFTLILEDLESYRVFERVREGLQEAGASRAVPTEIRSGRMAVEVESSSGPRRLLDRLAAGGRANGLEVRILDQGPGWVRVRARLSGVSAPRGRR